MAKKGVVIEPARKLGRKKLTAEERAERNASGYYNPDVRFIRVAGIRTAKILSLLKNLRKCANPLVYESKEKDVNNILAALKASVERTEKAFLNPSINGRSGVKYAKKPVDNFLTRKSAE